MAAPDIANLSEDLVVLAVGKGVTAMHKFKTFCYYMCRAGIFF